MTLEVGSQHDLAPSEARSNGSRVFVNGNLARSLAAAFRVTGNETYLREALRWCDSMLRVMMPILDSRGRPAAYWGTGGHVPAGPIYLGDTGTAAAAIAMISRHAPAAARERYVGALRKFFRFVMNGTQAPPPGGFSHNRTQASPGWQLPNGAFGAGYFVGTLTLTPYTVSTATTGMSFASSLCGALEHVERTRSAEDVDATTLCEGDRVALRASAWLSSIVLPSAAGTNAGVIPYCWLGTCYANNDSYGGLNSYLNNAAYVADGIVAMDQRSTDGARATLLRQFRPVVMHLCDTQHGNGSWGVPMGTDQQRSHRLAAIWDVTVAAAQKLGG